MYSISPSSQYIQTCDLCQGNRLDTQGNICMKCMGNGIISTLHNGFGVFQMPLVIEYRIRSTRKVLRYIFYALLLVSIMISILLLAT